MDMNLGIGERATAYRDRIAAMIRDRIAPAEDAFAAEIAKGDRWTYTARQTEILEGMKGEARERGLWNFWLTDGDRGLGLGTVDYAYLAEEMGKSHLAAEVFNCNAPDTGNMEVLDRYGTRGDEDALAGAAPGGRVRSAYLMTEPETPSSDATQIAMSCRRDGDEWVLDGEKWWATGAGDPRCAVYIVMARTGGEDAPKHAATPCWWCPPTRPGIEKLRPMLVYGHDDAPHGHWHLRFTGVRVPAANDAAGRGARLRDRAGPSRAGAHPPLHARHRPGREGAGADVPPRARPRGLRQAAGAARRQLRHHRRGADGDRAGAPALPQGGLDDGRGDARAAAPWISQIKVVAPRDGAEGDGHGGADAWRPGRQPGHAPGPRPGPMSAPCAWPTARTRCTAARSPAPSCAATPGTGCERGGSDIRRPVRTDGSRAAAPSRRPGRGAPPPGRPPRAAPLHPGPGLSAVAEAPAAPSRRSDYVLLRPMPTRWFDNDVYGHLNNSVHYQLFDTAVNGHLAEAGLLDPVAGATVFLVVESGCRYHAPLAFPEPVTAGLRVARLGRASVRYRIGLFGGAAEVAAAEGHFVHVCVGREDRRSRPIPDPVRALLAGLLRP